MRPHRLRLTAFGAFGDTATVDFDRLAGGGLFLLHGDTGAGKTTLLDAIGFALYGSVPGARAESKRLRSDHAAAGTRTEVELEATLAGRRLRVTRSPEQERAKLRGSGTTKEPARVLLQERVGEQGGTEQCGTGHDNTRHDNTEQWETLSTRAGEADTEIADLLGMSADQFFQVVLLPQGEFARFLRADAGEKGRLLERLFGTDRFRNVEHRLAELRRSAQAELERQRDVVDRLVARVCQVGGAPDPEGPVDERWLVELGSSAEAARARADLMFSRAERERAAAEQQAKQAADLAGRQQRRRAAEHRQAELAQEAPGILALGAEHDAAMRATGVAAALQTVARLAGTAEQTAAAATTERQHAAQSGGPGVTSEAEDYRAAAQGHREQLGRLDALQTTATQAEQEQEQAAGARARADQLSDEVAAVGDRLAATGPSRQQLTGERERASAAAAALPEAQAVAALARAAADDASALAALEREERPLAAALVGLREQAVALREHASDLRSARIDGMVAELAAQLEPDTPCPVCGSTVHPDPTELRVPAARVTPEAEKAAYRAVDAAEAERSSHAERLSGLLARRGDLRARLAAGGVGPEAQRDPAALAEQATAAAALAQRHAAAAGSLPRIDGELAELDQLIRQLSQAQATGAEQRAGAQHEAQEAARRAVGLERAVREQLGGSPDLAAAVRATGAKAEGCALAAAAVEAAARSRAELNAATREAGRLAREAGFADTAAAAEAVRVPAWREQAAKRLRGHRDAEAAVRAVLEDPDLADLTDLAQDTPDVTAAQAADADARAAWQTAGVAADATARTAGELAVLTGRLRSALAVLEPVAARHAEVRGLADLAAGTGGNVLKMTLSSYVLAARLEEVAAGASERLLRMTQGRYSLVHTDTGRGNARAGLGLLVRDTWTGFDRDTSTLSGGETFLASLSLALGLADAVAAESGGARLEALFVDEGFGSLDEETLDEVMDVLDGLREGGRLVGIVSHVAELRQRIPTQLHVRKGRHGSAVTALGEVV